MRVLFTTLFSLGLAVSAVAERPINPPASEFPPVSAWLNATQLSLARLRGRKVVVIAFINPTSINSIRVLPALKAWFDRYALSQVMVIGVLTPDLNFHREPIWAKKILQRYGIEHPVILDSDRRIWKAYSNEGWPALYLVDKRGRIVFDRLGEGGYREFESELRLALADLIGAATLPPPDGNRRPSAQGMRRHHPRDQPGGPPGREAGDHPRQGHLPAPLPDRGGARRRNRAARPLGNRGRRPAAGAGE